jgi:hypothetical protein
MRDLLHVRIDSRDVLSRRVITALHVVDENGERWRRVADFFLFSSVATFMPC